MKEVSKPDAVEINSVKSPGLRDELALGFVLSGRNYSRPVCSFTLK